MKKKKHPALAGRKHQRKFVDISWRKKMKAIEVLKKMNKDQIGLIVGTLWALQESENEGRGVTIIRDIVEMLKRGELENAVNLRQLDGDKTRSYRQIEQRLINFLGCRMHGELACEDDHCVEAYCEITGSCYDDEDDDWDDEAEWERDHPDYDEDEDDEDYDIWGCGDLEKEEGDDDGNRFITNTDARKEMAYVEAATRLNMKIVIKQKATDCRGNSLGPGNISIWTSEPTEKMKAFWAMFDVICKEKGIK